MCLWCARKVEHVGIHKIGCMKFDESPVKESQVIFETSGRGFCLNGYGFDKDVLKYIQYKWNPRWNWKTRVFPSWKKGKHNKPGEKAKRHCHWKRKIRTLDMCATVAIECRTWSPSVLSKRKLNLSEDIPHNFRYKKRFRKCLWDLKSRKSSVLKSFLVGECIQGLYEFWQFWSIIYQRDGMKMP